MTPFSKMLTTFYLDQPAPKKTTAIQNAVVASPTNNRNALI